MKINKSMIKQIISLVLIVLVSLIIFGFSSQNGEESSSISRKVAAIVVDIFNKDGQEDVILGVERIIRKLAHFSIYALLGICIIAFVDTLKLKDKNKIIITIIVALLYASSDELHQSFVGGRSASYIDVIIDTLGASFGLFLMLLFKNITKKLQNH